MEKVKTTVPVTKRQAGLVDFVLRRIQDFLSSCSKAGPADRAPELLLLAPQAHREAAPPEPRKHQ